MEEFSILLIKNLKAKNYLPKVTRNDLIFQIASSSDHVSIRNLRNVRLNNFESIIAVVLTKIRRKHDREEHGDSNAHVRFTVQ